MKKLLFITLLLFLSSPVIAQQHTWGSKVVKNVAPKTLTVVTAYPNPFSTETRVNFNSTVRQTVTFTVKNLLGNTVYMERINAKKGRNYVPFKRDNLQNGMYIYSLQTDTEIVSKRLVIR
ncbi:MAG: T9SS type A sorting domain-containing protein [Flavobacteriaceae bacterium]|nr:T9SS type A sorting domain-containing protein [Flavobacteriaceae bacterium]